MTTFASHKNTLIQKNLDNLSFQQDHNDGDTLCSWTGFFLNNHFIPKKYSTKLKCIYEKAKFVASHCLE